MRRYRRDPYQSGAFPEIRCSGKGGSSGVGGQAKSGSRGATGQTYRQVCAGLAGDRYLLQRGSGVGYDQALRLIVELHEALKHVGQEAEFQLEFLKLMQVHGTRKAWVARLKQTVHELSMAVKRLAEQKPVVAYAAGSMTSGSYYASIWTDHIMANPGAFIGSIGVLFHLPILPNWQKNWEFQNK